MSKAKNLLTLVSEASKPKIEKLKSIWEGLSSRQKKELMALYAFSEFNEEFDHLSSYQKEVMINNLEVAESFSSKEH